MKKRFKKISFSKKFLKQLKKSPLEIKIAFRKRLELFIENSFDRKLNNHPLTGRFSGYRSLNVSGDWRAIFSEYEEESGKIFIFEVIGTHSQLYK